MICQSIKGTVSALEKRYEGKAKIIRVNVDAPEARAYIQKYRVRATPSFVLFDKSGRLIFNTAGWPGENQIAKTFDELIAPP